MPDRTIHYKCSFVDPESIHRQADSGWNRYRLALSRSGVKTKIHRGHAQHVKRFLFHFTEQDIANRTTDDVLTSYKETINVLLS